VTLAFVTAALCAWRASHGKPVAGAQAAVRQAVVKLSVKAVEGARTAATLGAEREGTGIVIDDAGHVLTIGYLVLEAASILLMTSDGRIYPATVAGFDHVTGVGLLRAPPAICSQPVALGDSSALRELHTVCVAAHSGAGGFTRAAIIARRRFTGWWEYMLDEAIFTAPPRYEHSGAALLDEAGRLVGIASLWVSDALDIGAAFPGNMFVPMDQVQPILGDLVNRGRRAGPARPWLGVYSEQQGGHVVVSRVLPGSPAQRAGLQRGDVILGVGGDSIGGQSEFYQKLWAFGDAGCSVPLHVLHDKKVREIMVESADRLAYLKPWARVPR